MFLTGFHVAFAPALAASFVAGGLATSAVGDVVIVATFLSIVADAFLSIAADAEDFFCLRLVMIVRLSSSTCFSSGGSVASFMVESSASGFGVTFSDVDFEQSS